MLKFLVDGEITGMISATGESQSVRRILVVRGKLQSYYVTTVTHRTRVFFQLDATSPIHDAHPLAVVVTNLLLRMRKRNLDHGATACFAYLLRASEPQTFSETNE